MTRYQLRDTATGQLLARDLVDYGAAEAALDAIDDQLEQDLRRNGEDAGRIRLRLDVEKVTGDTTEPVGHHVLIVGVDDQLDTLPAL